MTNVPKILLSSSLFFCLCSFSYCPQNKQNAPNQKYIDGLVRFERKYIHAADSISARGGWGTKVYAKVPKLDKLIPVPDQKWPDSIQVSITVAIFRGKPIEYTEIPISRSDDSYYEYDNYFLKGKIVAFKITHFIFKSNCGPENGVLKESTIFYFDSIANQVNKEHLVVDYNNKPVKSTDCYQNSNEDYIIYKSYLETPLAKFGTIPEKPRK